MDQYYYIDSSGQQKGPVPANSLTRFGVSRDTLVWKQGMTTWKEAGLLSRLSKYFTHSVPPPLPTPPPLPAASPLPMSPPNSQRPIVGKMQKNAVKPDNFMVWSIIATLFFCLPLC